MNSHCRTLFADLSPQSVHSATLTQLPDGSLLAAVYAFSYETAPDSRIIVSRLRGEIWETASTLVDFPGIAVGNPVLHTDSYGMIHLFFVVLYGSEWIDACTAHMTSTDGAHTWSTPRLINEQKGLMTKTRPVEVKGKLLLPVYDERRWCSHVLIAEPPFKEWLLYGDTTARGKTLQPAIVPLEDGTLLMYSRSTTGVIYEGRSFNNGYSWTASQPLMLPNPNSGVELLRLRNGTLLMVCNPSKTGRGKLALFLSVDEGRSWRESLVLEDSLGEFSYPYAVQANDGTVHLLYTVQRTAITHTVLYKSDFF